VAIELARRLFGLAFCRFQCGVGSFQPLGKVQLRSLGGLQFFLHFESSSKTNIREAGVRRPVDYKKL
jgi:hypothetical protein